MASVCGLEVFKIDLGDVENESAICRHIKKTFAKAAKRKEPTMVFFDEMDKVLPNPAEEYYTDRSKTILTQLLTLIDGMDSVGRVVFVATCNNYAALPETLTRPGRLDKKIGIGLPGYASRVEILNLYASRSACTFETPMEDVARLCVGFSCAALETLVNECILHSGEDGVVSDELLQERVFEIKNEDIPRKSSSVDDVVRACRNAGVFLVAKTFNDGHYILDLERHTVCNDFFNGVLSTVNGYYDRENCDDDDDDYYDEDQDEDEADEAIAPSGYCSKNDMTNAVTVLLGGYVAEELALRKIYDNVWSDLDDVDRIQKSMLENGMFGLHCHYNDDRDLPYTAAYLEKLNATLETHKLACYERAKGILEKNAGLLKRLVDKLAKEGVMQAEECDAFIAECGGLQK